MKRVATVLFSAMVLCLVLTSPTLAAKGHGALWVEGATSTPTHWNVEVGLPVTAEIRGVEVRPLPASITVWVKSSQTGNLELTAYRLGNTSDYSFTFTPPAPDASGKPVACATTIVSYITMGHNATNDLIDDGKLNGSSVASSGFRYLYLGAPLDCTPVPIRPTTWSLIKVSYR